MTEGQPIPALDLLIPKPRVHAERTNPVWQELRLHPPHLIAMLSDSVQYVINDENYIVGFEISDGAQDRIEATLEIHQEFPSSKILTLSTSLDNILEYWPDSHFYFLAMIMSGRVTVEDFLLPESRTYDTFTELVEVVDTARLSFQGSFDNVVIMSGRKQAGRASVMLNTFLHADDPSERQRFDRYFKDYMPQRLTTTRESRMHKAFPRYKNIAYKDILPNAAALRKKKFIVISSEDITGTNLPEDEDYTINSQGVKDWIDGTYGHEYLEPDRVVPNELEIVARLSSDPTETPRTQIPLIGTPRAQEAGIQWGVGFD